MIYFFDIDGVLADCSHRLHYLENKDYDSFYSDTEILRDTPIFQGMELYEDICSSPYADVYILTGRPERTQEATRGWFERMGQPAAPMIMRRNHDYRPAWEVKSTMLEKFIDMHSLDGPFCLIDDDPNNIKKFDEHFGIGLLFSMKRIKELK